MSLGQFTLSNTPASYSNNTFTLAVNFSSPLGVSPNPFIVTASVAGFVSPPTLTSVSIAFPNDFPLAPSLTQSFSFSNQAVMGRFILRISTPVFIFPGGSANLSEQIFGASQTTNAVPEPTTMLLLGTGLAGVGAVVVRKRRAAK